MTTTHLNSSTHGATTGTQTLTTSGPEARYSRTAKFKFALTGVGKL